MVDIPVNPDVLVWAREERRLSKKQAALALDLSEDDLTNYETGEKLPNKSFLNKLASVYQIQLASLLMPTPLPANTRPRLPDFRSVGGKNVTTTPVLAIAFENVFQQLDALRDLRELAPQFLGAPNLPKYDRHLGATEIALRERERLGITVGEQCAWSSDPEAYKRWRQVLEGLGVFVFSLKLGDPQDVRGFSWWDESGVAIIVVNNAESNNRAKIFTLLHEYCHLLIRLCGISDENRRSSIERFCNKFAAQFLMPPSAFISFANSIHKAGKPWTPYHVNKLATRFRTSATAVSFHMEHLELVPDKHYEDLRAGIRRNAKQSTSSPVIPHAEKIVTRYGTKFIDTIFDGVKSGLLSQLDAHEALGTKVDFFGEITNEVVGRKLAYSGS